MRGYASRLHTDLPISKGWSPIVVYVYTFLCFTVFIQGKGWMRFLKCISASPYSDARKSSITSKLKRKFSNNSNHGVKISLPIYFFYIKIISESEITFSFWEENSEISRREPGVEPRTSEFQAWPKAPSRIFFFFLSCLSSYSDLLLPWVSRKPSSFLHSL